MDDDMLDNLEFVEKLQSELIEEKEREGWVLMLAPAL